MRGTWTVEFRSGNFLSNSAYYSATAGGYNEEVKNVVAMMLRLLKTTETSPLNRYGPVAQGLVCHLSNSNSWRHREPPPNSPPPPHVWPPDRPRWAADQ
jgi:hypothetical protein